VIIAKVGAIITAAGNSHRYGEDKIFAELAHKPLLAWSVDTCQSSAVINSIVIVLNPNNIMTGKKLASDRNWSKVTDICQGGSRRQDSVFHGLKKLGSCDWVLIHDGARPFLTSSLILSGLDAAQETGSAIAAVPVTDTIKISHKNYLVDSTMGRDSLWSVQTPQIFRFDIISQAYQKTSEDVTDDATLVEKMGYPVKLYMGSYHNIKITTREDLVIAESISRGIIP
jgi:2-C-methyl-D-erythritol 4-phosphate cytidylyltransferase